ncbi:hypothetical protein [Arhodomonas sp. AD133]|uniref:hypothetical protein n=1 Tax=Arhodomonas sp. AD133 TaxID=3415009 RepID=UPI003EBFFA71
MRHKRIFSSLGAIACSALLAACGGGEDSNPLSPADLNIELHADTTTLPVQTGEFQYPYTDRHTTNVWAEITLENGDPIPSGTEVQFTVRGGQTSTGAIYPSDLSETKELPDGTEVPQGFWSWSEESGGGIARVIFHAWEQTGKVTIRASAVHPGSEETSYDDLAITVGSDASDRMPATITGQLEDAPVYTAGSGHDDTGVLAATIRDGADQLVEDPQQDNLLAEIVSDNPHARLRADGESGTNVSTSTVRGEANVEVVAGNQPERIDIKLTSDRDNNVEDGLQDPVTDTITVAISDGNVASLTLTGPYIDAIRANGVDEPFVLPLGEDDAFQDGTYSRVISVIATDRFGNPVPPGTQVRFTLIDSPLTGYPQSTGTFRIQGADGDAEEGGTTFESVSGDFVTDSVLPDDHLVITADPEGTNRSYIGGYPVDYVMDETTLFTESTFPLNNESGSSVDTGATLPYVIGRPQYGNVFSPAGTDDSGTASTTINYPITRLNQRALLVAEADGTQTTAPVFYASMRPLSLTSSHTELAPNSTTDVTLCLVDANDAPVNSVELGWSTTGGAQVQVNNGQPVVTGANGCTTVEVDIDGQITGGEPITLTFMAGEEEEARAEITIRAIGQGQLAGNISRTYVDDDNNGVNEFSEFTISVQLFDESGQPVANDPLTATAEADGDNAQIVSKTWLTGRRTNSSGSATVEFRTKGCATDTFTFTVESQGGASFKAVGKVGERTEGLTATDCQGNSGP